VCPQPDLNSSLTPKKLWVAVRTQISVHPVVAPREEATTQERSLQPFPYLYRRAQARLQGEAGLQLRHDLGHYVAMRRYNEKKKIREHYDFVSPYYQTLWGEHLHHGYWIKGDETKDKAQLQLIDYLARAANLPSECSVLDVGCGYGGTSIYLAKHYKAEATGITISPVQVEMANQAAEKAQVNAKFLCMDAEAMEFKKPFDVLWSMESISHYPNNAKFFASAAKLLKPGGTMAITDWFKKDGLTAREHKKFLEPIEKGMLVELQTMEEYKSLMNENGLQVIKAEVLNKNCAKTWDISVEIIKNKAFWAIAAKQGMDFVHFLKAFKTARGSFLSGNFVYGLLVAKKP
jgi:tocopherol O-methyltransferase